MGASYFSLIPGLSSSARAVSHLLCSALPLLYWAHSSLYALFILSGLSTPCPSCFKSGKKGGRSSLWPHLSLTWNSFWLGFWFDQSLLPDPTMLSSTVYKSLILLHSYSLGTSGGEVLHWENAVSVGHSSYEATKILSSLSLWPPNVWTRRS